MQQQWKHKGVLPDNDDVLLTISDLARYFGVSENTIRFWERQPEFPKPIKFPGSNYKRWRAGTIRALIKRLEGEQDK